MQEIAPSSACRHFFPAGEKGTFVNLSFAFSPAGRRWPDRAG